MKLISKTISNVVTETSVVELTAGNQVTVIDYWENGKVIDTVCRDEDGFDLSDDALFDAVVEFLEECEQEN